MTYAEKFPMLNKYKAFGLANVVGECGYAIIPCQLITCNECKFKSDVDSEFSLTCRGARTRWLMSACEDKALPKIIAEEDMEDVCNHIYHIPKVQVVYFSFFVRPHNLYLNSIEPVQPVLPPS